MSRSFGGPEALAADLWSGDIASAARYIRKPAFECAVIRDQQTFGSSRFPFTLARPEALSMTKICATLSLDLDNLWSYMKTHGDSGWERFPTYLDLVVPRVHFGYLHWLAGVSEPLAAAYFSAALRACDAAQVAPSLLLQLLDFLGRDDAADLAFFPGMGQTGAEKMDRTHCVLPALSERYSVRTIGFFASRIAKGQLPLCARDFGHQRPGETDASQVGVEGR